MGRAHASSPVAGRPLPAKDLAAEIEQIANMGIEDLRTLWRSKRGQNPPAALTKDLMARALCHQLQEEALGGLSAKLRKRLAAIADKGVVSERQLKIGATIVREYQGRVHEAIVVPGGFLWAGQIYPSLSAIARKITGTRWNGPKFFGLGVLSAGRSHAETAITAIKEPVSRPDSVAIDPQSAPIFEDDAASEGAGL
jgi:hypothetical protein